MPFKKFQIFFTLPQTPAPFCPSGTKTANPGMPVHSGGEASGTVAPDFGGWLPLGARENALEDRGHLFEPQASCVPCSPPLAFFRELRGTVSGIHQYPGPETVLRVPGVIMKHHLPTKKTAAPPRSPRKEIMFGTAVFRLTPREH